MRKFVIVLVFIVAVVWLFGQYFALKTGKDKNGAYNIVLVNKKSGVIHRIVGGK